MLAAVVMTPLIGSEGSDSNETATEVDDDTASSSTTELRLTQSTDWPRP